MISAIDHYKTCQTTVTTLSELAEQFDTVTKFASARGYHVFWRGQADHRWPLTSSLVRRLASTGPVDDTLLNKVEKKILDDADKWIDDLKNYQEPLDKLVYLQHHGVPTRLLDFTADPWVAAFFAVESLDNVDGRIFAVLIKEPLTKTPKGRAWLDYGTRALEIYDAPKAGIDFARLKAQEGVLAVGRLPSTQPPRYAQDPELEELSKPRVLLAEEVRRIISMPFKLVSLFSSNDKETSAAGSLCVTTRVHIHKQSVRRDLAGVGSGKRKTPSHKKISHSTMYPDVGGMLEYSRTLAALSKGVLIID